MTGEAVRFDITAALSEAEATALYQAWSQRQQRSAGPAGTWIVILLGLLAGLLAGLIAVTLGAVDSATGRLVAVLGFFAFWGGVWAARLPGARMARRCSGRIWTGCGASGGSRSTRTASRRTAPSAPAAGSGPASRR
ncbi:hypothetical protein [Inquilinus limosus]|uniref:hypothetical protein n=1 Tax=Inquilinus limosus TaxID=171674 RepID=UPI0011982337|nr:hypothetical protein [Inquilinus limosus]